MTEINSDLLERVQKLPIKQRKHFEELVADGEDNPKATAEQLRETLISGETDPHYQMATMLAAAALGDDHTESRFPSEQEARGGYRTEINRLREIDPDDPVANHLENMLVRLSKKEEKDQARAETVSTDAKKHQLKVEQTRLDNYEQAYSEAKQQRINELTRYGNMDTATAEQQFQQIEHASLSASLKRHHGIAA